MVQGVKQGSCVAVTGQPLWRASARAPALAGPEWHQESSRTTAAQGAPEFSVSGVSGWPGVPCLPSPFALLGERPTLESCRPGE